ncbi:hypothetical protein HK414_03400 [Ramlibacter terrae]|uniref:Uncharacterized protein n=1 Tax=Ramlibacter terrae TaxID=2732511 RepID=A0ABX6P1R6_9BURK|nr:hypothetical protein HK414_03400 [Ramlibacter terrae]
MATVTRVTAGDSFEVGTPNLAFRAPSPAISASTSTPGAAPRAWWCSRAAPSSTARTARRRS